MVTPAEKPPATAPHSDASLMIRVKDRHNNLISPSPGSRLSPGDLGPLALERLPEGKLDEAERDLPVSRMMISLSVMLEPHLATVVR